MASDATARQAGVSEQDDLLAELRAALTGPGNALEAADRLCHACVDLLGVDGASVSLVHQGASQGTFGSSGALSRRLEELQFTLGEGPCLDAVREATPVLVPDLADPGEQRWPAFTRAVLESGVRAVFALPVSVANAQIGSLDLFRLASGQLPERHLTAALVAARLAAAVLVDLMTAPLDWQAAGDGAQGGPWDQLASLERVEVYQATGMIVAALDVDPTEALLLLRAYAYARGLTASQVAWAVVERRLIPAPGEWRSGDAGEVGG